jgi:hypothetical protein
LWTLLVYVATFSCTCEKFVCVTFCSVFITSIESWKHLGISTFIPHSSWPAPEVPLFQDTGFWTALVIPSAWNVICHLSVPFILQNLSSQAAFSEKALLSCSVDGCFHSILHETSRESFLLSSLLVEWINVCMVLSLNSHVVLFFPATNFCKHLLLLNISAFARLASGYISLITTHHYFKGSQRSHFSLAPVILQVVIWPS